jgi:hypothetical protein
MKELRLHASGPQLRISVQLQANCKPSHLILKISLAAPVMTACLREGWGRLRGTVGFRALRVGHPPGASALSLRQNRSAGGFRQQVYFTANGTE